MRDTEPSPGDHLGPYVVEQAIGKGGICRVYRARHESLGGKYALKVLQATVDRPSVRERLQREGQAQSRLRHPNVTAVHDVLTVGGRPVLVMELVNGPNLEELLRARKLRIEQIDWLARGIIRGVAAAHQAGIVHRDLKPANVLIHEVDGDLVPKVTDFGLAKLATGVDDELTKAGQLFGSPNYMAPEQFHDARSADARADVFALGCLLYELVCGRQAYPGSDLVEILRRMETRTLVPLVKYRDDAPERIRDAIHGCLDPDPERRVQSCRALEERWFEANPTPWGSETLRVIRGTPAKPALTHEDTYAEEDFADLPTTVMDEVRARRSRRKAERSGVGHTLIPAEPAPLSLPPAAMLRPKSAHKRVAVVGDPPTEPVPWLSVLGPMLLVASAMFAVATAIVVVVALFSARDRLGELPLPSTLRLPAAQRAPGP